jgi:AcrR family transcriptional regulator
MNLSRQEDEITNSGGRANQKIRTRRALVDAAIRLAREGKSPTMAEVAEAALVSVPTAYRYFSDPKELWLEVALHSGVPAQADSAQAFAHLADDDVAGRVETAIKTVGWRMFDDEAVWRNVVQATLHRWFAQAAMPEDQRMPVRSERRMQWITTALEPLKGQIPDDTLRRLTMALALTFGTEALITLRDVCHLEPDEAQQTMLWAARAMLTAAIAAADHPTPTRPQPNRANRRRQRD